MGAYEKTWVVKKETHMYYDDMGYVWIIPKQRWEPNIHQKIALKYKFETLAPIIGLANSSREMTQKAKLFKGQTKKKSIAANRHGKAPQIRKGKRSIKPSKVTKDMDADRVSPCRLSLVVARFIPFICSGFSFQFWFEYFILGILNDKLWLTIEECVSLLSLLQLFSFLKDKL